ncbi:MAG: CPBP family intramembrane metalloprotease [Pirellulales bacterium]|nr:CPBP family intramembrane metalloprotease [Pirellulales bacterium]
MKWSNVKLILAREIRDQLRDRRTLFMIVVLPLLLYPLLGMSFFQISQFTQKHIANVLVIGARALPDDPPLIENNRFAADLFTSPDRAQLVALEFASDELPRGQTIEDVLRRAREQVEAAQYDAAIYFPPDFAERLERFRQASTAANEPSTDAAEPTAPSTGKPTLKSLPEIPRPEIIYTTANERSQIAFAHLFTILRRWNEEVGRANLSAVGLPPAAARPFEVHSADLAKESGQAGGGYWARLLPVMLVLWALTGAFYPAVDLCAGEKERGTLETLLSSPARRSEIVVGKLATIILFSMTTAVLNLAAMGFTGWLVLHNLPNAVAAPSVLSIVWLLVALVPISALFSALCLAVAALARSTKEGQYYLMPLMLVCMPLAILPMTPGITLNLGNSLVPVANVVLLLRTLLEGDFWTALRYCVPVIGMTLVCCLLAIRWAVDQFNQETVLFRESERLDVGLWLHHLFHERQPTPNVAMALSAGLLILVIKFFMSLAMPIPEGFWDLAKIALVTQLAMIAAPALIMTFMLTRSPGRTLLLDRASWRHVPMALPAAVALAVAIHPVAIALDAALVKLYPMPEGAEILANLLGAAPSFLILLLVIAVVPPVCEEIAFRGFILSGLRHSGRKWRAIVIAAVFFGMTHGIFQQQINAALLGVVIGYIAVQSGSLVPCIAYHMVHNALALAATRITPELLDRWPLLDWMVGGGEGAVLYNWSVVITGGMAAAMILTWFSRLPYQKTKEERLHDAIRRGIEADDEPLATTAM